MTNFKIKNVGHLELDFINENKKLNKITLKKNKTNYEINAKTLDGATLLNKMLKNDNKNVIRIGSAGPISIENSKQILSSLEKNRILISKNSKSDYIIDNYIKWGKYKKKRHEIPNNFKIYKEIFVSGKKIISIYKRI